MAKPVKQRHPKHKNNESTPPAETEERSRRTVAEHITKIGNLVSDPQLSFTGDGKPWLRTRLADTPREQAEDGQWRNGETMFYDLVCFGTVAEHAAGSLTKGDRVIVVGRGELETYRTNDGELREAKRIVADEIAPSLRWVTININRGRKHPQPAKSVSSDPEGCTF
jgi:single-strand DNA-binding protein